MLSTTRDTHIFFFIASIRRLEGVCTAGRAEFVIRRPRNGKDKLTKLAKLSQSRIKGNGNRRLKCHTEQKSASGLPRHSAQSSTPRRRPVAPCS